MRRLVPWIPVLVAAVFGSLWSWPATRDLAWRLSDENQPIEIATFFFLFAGGLVGLALARRRGTSLEFRRVRAFTALFALGMLFVAMEEVSWGQWFFGFDTPEPFRWRNLQGELNLHNLGPLHGKSAALRLAFAVGGTLGFAFRRAPLLRGIAPPRTLLPWLVTIGFLAGIEAAMDLGAFAGFDDATLLFQHAMPEVNELLVGIAAFLYVAQHLRRGGTRVEDLDDTLDRAEGPEELRAAS